MGKRPKVLGRLAVKTACKLSQRLYVKPVTGTMLTTSSKQAKIV